MRERDKGYDPFLINLHRVDKPKPTFTGRKKKVSDKEKEEARDKVERMKSKMQYGL